MKAAADYLKVIFVLEELIREMLEFITNEKYLKKNYWGSQMAVETILVQEALQLEKNLSSRKCQIYDNGLEEILKSIQEKLENRKIKCLLLLYEENLRDETKKLKLEIGKYYELRFDILEYVNCGYIVTSMMSK